MAFTREERADYIGGSDLAHVMNEPPYGCRRRLWYEKKLYPYDEPPEVTPAMLRGTELEPYIRERFEREHGYILLGNLPMADGIPEYIRPHIDDAIAPRRKDGKVIKLPSGVNAECPGIAEFKALGEATYSTAMGDGMANGYIFQAHLYMWAFDVAWTQWGILTVDSWPKTLADANHSPMIERQDFIVDTLKRVCEEFWEERVGDTPPEPPLDTEAGHCNYCPFQETCKGKAGVADIARVRALMEAAGEGYLIVKNPELEDLARTFDEWANILKEAGEQKSAVAARIEGLMSELGVRKAILPDRKVARVASIREFMRQKAFRKDHPDMWRKYAYEKAVSFVRTWPLSKKNLEEGSKV